MITGLIITFAYLAVSFGFARRAYRHEYGLIYGSPAPQYYGGKHGHDRAHEVALREAYWTMAFWPFFCTWAGIGWLISHGLRQSWVEQANEISMAQFEVDRLAAEQDPLRQLDDKPALCSCGYTDECPVHCGDGSCHELVSEYPIIRTAHPEAIREVTMAGEIVIDIPGCACSKCQSDPWLWEDKK